MYARSPDETLPQSSSSKYPLPLQLYPYHQQAFHQRLTQQQPLQDSPATFYPEYNDAWSSPAQRPRPNVLNTPTSSQTHTYPFHRPSLPDDNRQIPQVTYQASIPIPQVPTSTGFTNELPALPSHSRPHPSHGVVSIPQPQVAIPPHTGYNNSRPRDTSLSYASSSVATTQVSYQYPNPPVGATSGNYSSPSRPQQYPSATQSSPSVSPDPLQGQYATPAASIGPSSFSPPTQSVAPLAPDPLPPTNEEPSPVEEEDDIELALAISQSEMFQRQQEEMKMSNQEDEDLAKALAESLQTAGRSLHLFGGESSSMAASSVSHNPTSQDPSFEKNHFNLAAQHVNLLAQEEPNLSLPSQAPTVSQSNLPSSYIVEDDIDFGLANHRKWQIPAAPSSLQEGSSNGKSRMPNSPVFAQSGLPTSVPSGYSSETSLSRASTTHGLDRSDSLPKYGRLYKTQTERLSSSIAAMESLQQTDTDESRLVFDDDAYARQIAAEEEDDLRRRIEEKARAEAERVQQQTQQQTESERLPQYTSENVLSPDSEASLSSRRPSSPNETVPPLAPVRPRAVSSSDVVRHNTLLPFPLNQPSFDNRPPLSTVPSSSSVSSSVQSSQAGISDGLSPPYGNRPHANSFPSATAGPSDSSKASQQPSSSVPSVVNPNRFIDRELLTGVSIGFKPPVLSNRLVAMEDPMPNIISLPATRCPPLHLQAPTWRHMLRLLARLSNSRIEATVEAMSVSKTDIKLRTVVQFVKSHPYANTWHTILWFTIDHPVPPNAPSANRYLSGNPNLLPWSYTLSPVPMLLRDAADTSLSKTYTVPATDAVPLPTLPVTFPNLAHYLQAALEESRRNSRSSDSSSGLGKLGKMVQLCYPNVKLEDYDDDGPGGKSSGVTDLFKRVIGRGNKDKKKGKSTNEETYTMVTPFVNDEWG